jgi:hypothetical protein
MRHETLTREEVDDLIKDWFQRDGDAFVHTGTVDRVGWESTLDAGESYSAYLIEAPTLNDLIRRAYPLANDMLVSMNLPKKVHVKIHNGGTHCTDLKTVYLSTDFFDNKELSVGEKLDIFLGAAVHEGCHVLYTTTLHAVDNEVIRSLWNVIEDERIERRLGDDKPGFSRFLEKLRYYYFDYVYLEGGVIDDVEKKDDAGRFLDLLLRIIRYPKYLKESDFEYFGAYLMDIKEILSEFPDSTEESLRCAREIYEVIKDMYRDADKESTDKELSEKIEKDASEVIEKLRDLLGSATADEKPAGESSIDDTKMSDAVKKDDGLLGDLCEGTVELGSARETYFYPVTPNKEKYLEALSKVRRYVPAISKIIRGHCKEYKYIHRGMRSGTLDTNKLVEAIQGVPSVYIREGEVRSDRVAVCVLIDESGSMYGSRIEAAREAAVLLNEAIGSIPQVELFIYGHTGDMRSGHSTEMHVYREGRNAPKYALGAVEAFSQNRDGIAIVECAKRVRGHTNLPVLYFILSDGSPCAADYGGEAAMTHVRQCVKEVERMDFTVVQVCINHSYPPEKMFRRYIILEDMSTLAVSLGRVLKKATMRATTNRVY